MVSGGAGAWLRATCTKYHVPGPRAMSVQLMGPCGVRKVEVDSCLALQAPSSFIPTPFMGLVESCHFTCKQNHISGRLCLTPDSLPLTE